MNILKRAKENMNKCKCVCLGEDSCRGNGGWGLTEVMGCRDITIEGRIKRKISK